MRISDWSSDVCSSDLDSYGRIGNQAGSQASPVLLGDYKTDPDAELERPTRISLIDTRTAKIRLVDLPTSYSFRSLGRGTDRSEESRVGKDRVSTSRTRRCQYHQKRNRNRKTYK